MAERLSIVSDERDGAPQVRVSRRLVEASAAQIARARYLGKHTRTTPVTNREVDRRRSDFRILKGLLFASLIGGGGYAAADHFDYLPDSAPSIQTSWVCANDSYPTY